MCKKKQTILQILYYVRTQKKTKKYRQWYTVCAKKPTSICAKQKNIPTSISASIWKIYTETKTKSGSATNNCKKETVTLKCHKNVRTVVIYRITVCTNPHAVKIP